MALKERDLEMGRTTSEENLTDDRVKISKKMIKLHSGLLDFKGSFNDEAVVGPVTNASKFGSNVTMENVELRIDKRSGDEQSQDHVALLKKKLNENRISSNPHKPPRPPKGPALDVADMKLIKEISDLAMKKRMRIERVKALKKKRAAKTSSSSSSSLFSMIITVLFFLIVIFQGISCRGNSSSKFEQLPEAEAVSNRDGLISVEYSKKISSEESIEPSFG